MKIIRCEMHHIAMCKVVWGGVCWLKMRFASYWSGWAGQYWRAWPDHVPGAKTASCLQDCGPACVKSPDSKKLAPLTLSVV